MARRLAIGALVVACGCGRTGIAIGQATATDSDTFADGTTTELDPPGRSETSVAAESSSTGPLICDPDTGICQIELQLRRAVDILFVVDNSGSMGGEQGTLAQSFRSFIDVLEDQEVGANYRIAVTTTDGSGSIRASSCRERLFEFVFDWQFGSIDERQRGCLDNCSHETLAITDPWVEKSGGTTNIPDGVQMWEALQCIGPQGINGPGYELHLESMMQSLQNEASGFIREDALLAVIFLTDEADCSATVDNHNYLATTGTVFWTAPDRATSGVCWTAGVECAGGPGIYDDCVAVDKDANGFITANENEAMLYPVSRYVDFLNDIRIQKQVEGAQGGVLLALIGGVPVDYPETGIVTYQDSEFLDFNQEYGIGPGCDRGTETINDPPGIPPVRLKEVAEQFATEDRNIYSICANDYGVALEQVAEAIGTITERACVGGCAVDDREDIPGLQPRCTLIERFAPDAGQDDHSVAPCTIIGDTWDFPGPEVVVCYRPLTDPGMSTPSPVDDMSAQCAPLGFNLELVIERRESAPVPAGTVIEVVCDLLGEPGLTCEEV